MCEVFKLLNVQNSKNLSLKNKLKKKVKHRIPFATRKLKYIFHHSK